MILINAKVSKGSACNLSRGTWTYAQRDQWVGVAPTDCWNWGKWGLLEYIWKGSFLGLDSLGSSCWYNFCSALAALVSQNKILFSSPHTYTLNLVPIAQQPGQAAVLGRLSLCICLCLSLTHQWLYRPISLCQPAQVRHYTLGLSYSTVVFSQAQCSRGKGDGTTLVGRCLHFSFNRKESGTNFESKFV